MTLRNRNVPLLALASILATIIGCNGCGTSSTSAQGTPDASSGAKKGIKVGIVFDSGGRGDKSFNDSAWAGIEKAKSNLGLTDDNIKQVESKSEKDYEGNLSGMAEAGCDLIFAVGLSQGVALTSVAAKYPNIKFAIIDGMVDKPNVRSIQFTEEQGSFLAGYLAGLVTKSNKIGFVGGKKIALIEKFEAGYDAGAEVANPRITLEPAKYTDSWDDTALGKEAAETLYNDGADIVYHAAGRAGLGVIEAAKERGKFAIGVDSDQDDQAPGTVLTSMVKHVDIAVFQTIKDVEDGKFQPGVKRYDLADDGVGLTDFKDTKDKIGDANIAKVHEEADLIKAGKIKVPTSLSEIPGFLTGLKLASK